MTLAPGAKRVDRPRVLEPLPYALGWLDNFFQKMQQVPVPSWLLYLALWLAQTLLFNAIAWVGGIQRPGYFDVILSLWGLYTVYYLALLHSLDRMAVEAWAAFRPVFTGGDEANARLAHELTVMPPRGVWKAGLVGLAVTLAALPFSWASPYDQTPAARNLPLLGVLVSFVANFFVAICVYNSIRQLRIVRRIHGTLAEVNLFRREPLYAFSALTSRTTMGYLLAIALGVVPRSGPAHYSFLSYCSLVLFTVVAIAAFIIPLWDVHRLLVQEKRRRVAETLLRVDALLHRLHERVDSDSLDDVGLLRTTLDTLLAERDLLIRMPTWPWRSGVVTHFLSAVSLPLTVWLAQQIISQLALN